MIPRKEHADWPRLLLPEVGCYPPASAGPPERVLHVALRTPQEKQPALAAALASLGTEYADVDWQDCYGNGHFHKTLFEAAKRLRPTFVFMQLQCSHSPVNAEVIAQLRSLCDPTCVIANWDGDQHHEAEEPERRWFVELGQVCDASLVVNTDHPARYAALGVRHPGYLQIGIDGSLYRPTKPTPNTPEVVFLAGNYPHLVAYDHRREIVHSLSDLLGQRSFGVYGHGWAIPTGRPFLQQNQEAGVYTAARASVCSSIRADLARYSSDRLFRCLASGAVSLVEHFPDCEGLGLSDMDNCVLWRNLDQLRHCIDVVLASPAANWTAMRSAAAKLGKEHTWTARMPELLAIIAAVRGARA